MQRRSIARPFPGEESDEDARKVHRGSAAATIGGLAVVLAAVVVVAAAVAVVCLAAVLVPALSSAAGGPEADPMAAAGRRALLGAPSPSSAAAAAPNPLAPIFGKWAPMAAADADGPSPPLGDALRLRNGAPRLLKAMPALEHGEFAAWKQQQAERGTNSSVVVLLWDNSGGTPFYWGEPRRTRPNYGGFDIELPPCPVKCEVMRSRARLAEADAVLFDPCYSGPSQWRDVMRHQPARAEGQQWWWFTYEQREYFPQMKRPELMSVFDYRFNYMLDAEVHTSFMCPWGGHTDWLAPPVPFAKKRGGVAFLASNCHTGGAAERTEYVRQLMKFIPVDSYGACLHNKPLPSGDRGWQGSFGEMMDHKIRLLRDYKFFLAFENNNITDYVTEKLASALLAGSVPVYMGSSNVKRWAPDDHAVIRVDDFNSPRELAEYLNSLMDDEARYEAHLEWKRRGYLLPAFRRIVDDCIFYAECRLCEAVAYLRSRIAAEPTLGCARATGRERALVLNRMDMGTLQRRDGLAVSLSSLDSALSALNTDLSITAWVMPTLLSDGRIVDRAKTQQFDEGFFLDVYRPGSSGAPAGYLRFCGAGMCATSSRALARALWYHVAVTFRPDAANGLKFYINGVLDSEHSTLGKQLVPSQLDVHIGMPAQLTNNWSPHHGEGVFEGMVDDITLWAAELSAEDVRLLQFRRLCGNEPGLVFVLTFNEEPASAGSFTDHSVNRLTARVIGSPLLIPSVSKPLTDLTLLHGNSDRFI